MKSTTNQTSMGQSAVEFALILPVLFLVIFGIFDFGRAFSINNSLAHAVREGGRVGIVCSTDTQIRNKVREQAGLAGNLPDGQITIAPAWGSRAIGTPITVTATYGFVPATPLIAEVWGGGALTLTAATSMLMSYPNQCS